MIITDALSSESPVTITADSAITSPVVVPPLPHSVFHYIHNTMPLMDGWCSIAKAEALARLVLSTSPTICVEIGVFAGRSLLAIAQASEHLSHGRVIGIDPWSPAASVCGNEQNKEHSEWWAQCDHSRILHDCRLLIQAQQLSHRVSLVQATSEAAAPILSLVSSLTGSPFIDLLHIDGNHSEKISCYDAQAYIPLVRPGGSVIFDDTNWGSTKAAQQLLAETCDFQHFVEFDNQQCGFYTKKAGCVPASPSVV